MGTQLRDKEAGRALAEFSKRALRGVIEFVVPVLDISG
jgi:hypothetical protein